MASSTVTWTFFQLLLTCLFLVSCSIGDRLVEFDYKGYDGDGVMIVRGLLRLRIPEGSSEQISGNWEIRPVLEAPDGSAMQAFLRVQTGSARLSGRKKGSELVVYLRDDVDRRIVLSAILDGEDLEGKWEYYSAAGLTATGTFRATRVTKKNP